LKREVVEEKPWKIGNRGVTKQKNAGVHWGGGGGGGIERY